MSEPNFERHELSNGSPDSSARTGRPSASPANSVLRPSTFRDANSERLNIGAKLESGTKRAGPSPTAPQPFLPFDQPAFSGAEDPASSSPAPPDYRPSIGSRYPFLGSNNPPTWRDLNRRGDLGPGSALPTNSDALSFANGISVQQHPYDLSMYTPILIR
jgi:hypothetical protein